MIGCSTLENWIVKARNQEFETHSTKEINGLSQDKRPQDWTLEERLNVVILSSTMSEEALSEYCREQGIYPHHVKQWKLDIVSSSEMSKADSRSKMKALTQENKALKKS